jgi:hypothetical protein
MRTVFVTGSDEAGTEEARRSVELATLSVASLPEFVRRLIGL